MRSISVDSALVAHCGLYCGACKAYRKGRCPGCHDNHKATWCTVRTCCREHAYASCADCTEHPDPMQCRKYNNFISKLIGLVLRSDRAACIRQIKERGIQGHAEIMAAQGTQTIRK